MTCADCKGVAHPASGCQYSPRTIVCGPCVRRTWAWIRQFTSTKGMRSGIAFYDHAGKPCSL